MSGKITEKDPNFEKEDQCKCNGSCKTRSCSCFKFGSGCDPSCGCGTSCANMFGHLGYFFGDHEKFDANTCFAKWLVGRGNDELALKSVDREKLLKRIMKSDSFADLIDDDEIFKKWKMDEKKMTTDDQKLAHTQKLFRMVLSNDFHSQYYYSFCQDDILNIDNAWHCISCRSCMEWNEWHCGDCDKCVYGISLACEGCGGISEVGGLGS